MRSNGSDFIISSSSDDSFCSDPDNNNASGTGGVAVFDDIVDAGGLDDRQSKSPPTAVAAREVVTATAEPPTSRSPPVAFPASPARCTATDVGVIASADIATPSTHHIATKSNTPVHNNSGIFNSVVVLRASAGMFAVASVVK